MASQTQHHRGPTTRTDNTENKQCCSYEEVTCEPEIKPEFISSDFELIFEELSLSKLCRVCAEVGESMIDIFGAKGKELQLFEKITRYLPISISRKDHLPLRVCLGCVAHVNSCHELVQRSWEANAKLHLLLQIQNNSKAKTHKRIKMESGSDVISPPCVAPLTVPSHTPPAAARATTQISTPHVISSHTPSQPIVKEERSLDLPPPKLESANSKRSQHKKGLEFRKHKISCSFICDCCKKHFVSKVKLKHHVQAKPVGCSPNNNKQSVVKKVRCDVRVKTVQCDLCPLKFNSHRQWQRHKNIVHLHKFRCSVCDLVLASSNNLQYHMQGHLGLRPFACSHCDQRFTMNSFLKNHVTQFHNI